jgi:hypothetical protein
VEDNIFKLDDDFDFILYADEIKILHPQGFINIADIDQIILGNITQIASNISGTFNQKIDLSLISNKMPKAKRISKLLASINARKDLGKTNIAKLHNMCQKLNVVITYKNGVLAPNEHNMFEFLEILDRRLFDYDLTDEIEHYVAPSRKKR